MSLKYRIINLYKYMKRDIPHGISNIIRWIPIIWSDYHWDWVFLARIMEYKFRKMANILQNGNHVDCEKDAAQCLECADILKRLIDDNYAEECGYDENYETLSQKQKRQVFIDANKKQKIDLKRLGYLIGKYLLCWWD